MSVETKTKKLNSQHIRTMKGGAPIVGLTAYTASIASAMDPIVDVILVGDSVAMTIYGETTTVGVDLETMIRHGRAVSRAAQRACVVVDMPFGSYEASPAVAFENAARLMGETGCDAVKLEGGVTMAETVDFLTKRGVPVMGHIGLTPQAVNTLGGFKTQGKDDAAVQALLDDAKAMNDAGCFSIVVEGVVETAARRINEVVAIPTIGIGASVECDGQILVTDDLIGLFESFKPKFVKRYAEVMPIIRGAIESFAADVRARRFPDDDHVFHEKKSG